MNRPGEQPSWERSLRVAATTARSDAERCASGEQVEFKRRLMNGLMSLTDFVTIPPTSVAGKRRSASQDNIILSSPLEAPWPI